MSRILIATAQPCTDLACVKFLYQRLGLSLAVARRLLADGSAGVFYDCVLFMNDYEEREPEVRDILGFFTACGVALRVHELDEDEDWAQLTVAELEQRYIGEQLLLNMMESHALNEVIDAEHYLEQTDPIEAPPGMHRFKLLLSVAEPTERADVIEFVHAHSGWSRPTVRLMLSAGKARCFFSCELFRTDHAEQAEAIRQILAFFNQQQLALCIIRVDADSHWQDVDMSNSPHLEMTEGQLLGLLDALPG
ncbi:hypothetical protein [Pseudomonas sp. NPDC089406]|uniref:hypothetical protein n=1 Tax=Pseudomonas sp. NPDC089406 TaxID=3364463 RepID=UPI00384BEAAE